MIEVTMLMEKGTLKLTVRGHACTAPRGKDLVCAGVSSLVLTAGEVAARLEKRGWLTRPPLIRLKPGSAMVFLTPHREMREQTMLCFWTVQAGLSRLEQMYPQCIRINRDMPMQKSASGCPVGTGMESPSKKSEISDSPL